jgi:hypothetical protein
LIERDTNEVWAYEHTDGAGIALQRTALAPIFSAGIVTSDSDAASCALQVNDVAKVGMSDMVVTIRSTFPWQDPKEGDRLLRTTDGT